MSAERDKSQGIGFSFNRTFVIKETPTIVDTLKDNLRRLDILQTKIDAMIAELKDLQTRRRRK